MKFRRLFAVANAAALLAGLLLTSRSKHRFLRYRRHPRKRRKRFASLPNWCWSMSLPATKRETWFAI